MNSIENKMNPIKRKLRINSVMTREDREKTLNLLKSGEKNGWFDDVVDKVFFIKTIKQMTGGLDKDLELYIMNIPLKG